MNHLSSIHLKIVYVCHYRQKIEIENEDITRQFHQFRNYFLDEFNEFKAKFLHKVKLFKDNS